MTICLESNRFSRKQVLHNLAQNYRGNSAEIRGDRCHICISLYFAKPLVRHSAANFGRTVSSRINHRFMSKWDALKQFSHGLWTKLCFFLRFWLVFPWEKRVSFSPITIVTYPLSWQQVSWFLPRPSVTHEQTTNSHPSRTQWTYILKPAKKLQSHQFSQRFSFWGRNLSFFSFRLSSTSNSYSLPGVGGGGGGTS